MTLMVEVSAKLADALVSVHPVYPPLSRRRVRLTRVLCIATPLLFLLSAYAFFVSVKTAAANRRSFAAWVEAGTRPIYDWRPERQSPWHDVLAFGGLFAGFACLALGWSGRARMSKPSSFRIGWDKDVDYPTSDAPESTHALVTAQGEDFVCHVADGMICEIIEKDKRPTIAGLGPLTLRDGSRYRIAIGNQTFDLTMAEVSTEVERAPLMIPAIGFVTSSALAHLGLWSLLQVIPPDPTALSIGSDDDMPRMSKIFFAPPETPIIQPPPRGDGTLGALTPMALQQSGRGPGETGQQPRISKNPTPTQDEQVDRARRGGILGLIPAHEFENFYTAIAATDFTGMQPGEVLACHNPGPGGFGDDLAGTGPGGPGGPGGPVGDRFGYLPIGPGRDPYGDPNRVGDPVLRRRETRVPTVVPKNSDVAGDIDKAIVRQYVRQKLSRIRTCYERELLEDTNLEGTLVTDFQIGSDGSVQGVTASGLNADVESCVADAIRSIRFPAPKGGGRARVRYPFHFHSAN
jgi:hypothetical protein